MVRSFVVSLLAAVIAASPVGCRPTKQDTFWKDASRGMVLASPAFEEDAVIPARYTCSGENISPPLTWSGAPDSVRAYVITCIDPDAPSGSFRHWIIYDIPGSATSLPEGVSDLPELPDGGKQGLNDFGNIGYGGPCPPSGKPHHYIFHLYALDAPTGVPAGSKFIGPILAAMRTRSQNHILAESRLFGTYGR